MQTVAGRQDTRRRQCHLPLGNFLPPPRPKVGDFFRPANERRRWAGALACDWPTSRRSPSLPEELGESFPTDFLSSACRRRRSWRLRDGSGNSNCYFFFFFSTTSVKVPPRSSSFFFFFQRKSPTCGLRVRERSRLVASRARGKVCVSGVGWLGGGRGEVRCSVGVLGCHTCCVTCL